jgi:hypothetical protein
VERSGEFGLPMIFQQAERGNKKKGEAGPLLPCGRIATIRSSRAKTTTRIA